MCEVVGFPCEGAPALHQRGSAASVAGAEAAVAALPGVKFLQARDAIVAKLKAMKEDLGDDSPTATIKILQTLDKSFDEKRADRSGLPNKFSEIIQEAQDLLADIVRAFEDTSQMNRGNVAHHQSALDGLEKRVSEFNVKFEDQESCAGILLSKAMDKARSEYQKDYQRERRLISALKRGKFSGKHASFLAQKKLELDDALEADGVRPNSESVYWGPSGPPRGSAAPSGWSLAAVRGLRFTALRIPICMTCSEGLAHGLRSWSHLDGCGESLGRCGALPDSSSARRCGSSGSVIQKGTRRRRWGLSCGSPSQAYQADANKNPIPEHLNGCLCAENLDGPVEAVEPYLFKNDKLETFLGTSAAVVVDKVAAMENAIRKKPKWHGCVGDIPDGLEAGMNSDIPWEEILGTGDENKLIQEDGMTPWIMTNRVNQQRFGPTAFPIPGCGAILHNLNKSVYIHFYPIREVLRKGMDAESFLSFQEAESCEKLREDETWVFLVQPGHWRSPKLRDSQRSKHWEVVLHVRGFAFIFPRSTSGRAGFHREPCLACQIIVATQARLVPAWSLVGRPEFSDMRGSFASPQVRQSGVRRGGGHSWCGPRRQRRAPLPSARPQGTIRRSTRT